MPGALLLQRCQVQIGDIEGAVILRWRRSRIKTALESYTPYGGSELTVELDRLGRAFGPQHQVSRALQDVILQQTTDLGEILGLGVQGQTGSLRSTWEHAIGDERSLVCLHTHVL